MTSPHFWFGVALGVLLAALGLAVLFRRAAAPDSGPLPASEDLPGEPLPRTLPRTLLQTRAQWGLAIGGLSAVAALAVVLVGSPSSFHENESLRLLVYGVFALGLLAYGVMMIATRRAHRGEVQLDERDHAILARAPRAQAAAILITLLVWAVALTELYWDSGQVPIAFPFLIFLSSCVVGLLAFSAGILVGYRRS